MVHLVWEVAMHSAPRSSRASHDRQRKEMEAQDLGIAVGSPRVP